MLFAATGWPLYRTPGMRMGYDGGHCGAAPDTHPGKYTRIAAPNLGGIPHHLGPMESGPNLYFSDVKIKNFPTARSNDGDGDWEGSKLLQIGEIITPIGFKIYAISMFAQRPYVTVYGNPPYFDIPPPFLPKTAGRSSLFGGPISPVPRRKRGLLNLAAARPCCPIAPTPR